MGPAAIAGTVIGGLIGGYEAKSRGDAARRAHEQGTTFDSTSTFAPYGPTLPFIEQLFGESGGLADAFGTSLPDFPEFHGFGFGNPVDFLSYVPELTGVTETPEIGRAAQTSQSLRRVRGLLEEDPFLPSAGEALEDIFESTTPQHDLAQNYLLGGPLYDTAEGFDLEGPFSASVAKGLTEDADRLFATQVGQIKGGASSVGRSGEGATSNLVGDQAQKLREDVLSALSLVRASAFEGAQNRQLAAGQTVAGGLEDLSRQRSNELLTGISVAPALETARFVGPGLEGSLASNADRINQASDMFEANFGQTETGRSQSNLLSLLGLENQSRQFGAGLDAANAQAFNAHNLGEFNFDLSSPFLRSSQLAQILLPFASAFGTRTTSGVTREPEAYTPEWWIGLLSGAVGGAQSGAGLGGLFGGGGSGGGRV